MQREPTTWEVRALTALLVIFTPLTALAVAIAITNPTNSKLVAPEQPQGEPNEIIPPAKGATFLVTGDPNVKFNLTIPNRVDMTLGADSIRINNMRATPGSGNGCCTLDASGKATVQVGGTRTGIQASDDAGVYSGSFNVSARYQSGGATSTASALAEIRVLRVLSATVNTPLNTGGGAAGDGPKIIVPGGFGSAQVTVKGEPGRLVNISFPTASITMNHSTGGGNVNKRIAVSSFTSLPSGQGTFDPTTGDCVVRLGATRAALTAAQVQGTYTGTFTVRFLYP